MFQRYKYILVFFCLALGYSGTAQIKDKKNKSIRIPAEESKIEKDSTPVKIKVAPKLDAEKEKTNKTQKKYSTEISDKPFSMTDNDGLKSPSEIYEQRWNKEAEKIGLIKTMSDQFLGEHRVDTKFVNIVCRDHEYPDGDRVRIYINGLVIKENLLLKSNYRRVEVNLSNGKNTIDIEALNQGESGPNTAEFIIYDDKGSIVSSKEWNLLTGVKATIVFINEKLPTSKTATTASNTTTTEENDESSNN